MLENMAQVQKYVYILVSQKQISFVLFTYSMSRKKRGYIYVLKLVPTVPGNGQKAGNHERGCTSKHFRVPTLLSILQNAPLPKNTEFGSSKQTTQLSLRLLCLLCAREIKCSFCMILIRCTISRARAFDLVCLPE